MKIIMETPTINSRLVEVREALHMKKGEFAAYVGIEQSRYSKMESGPSKPATDALELIAARIPSLNLRWLLSGKGEMMATAGQLSLPADPKPATPTAGPLSLVPESEQVKELKAQNEELRKQLEFMRDLMRSGVDFSRLQPTGSFSLGDALAVVETGPPCMRIAA